MGKGAGVSFRNLRIKELKKDRLTARNSPGPPKRVVGKSINLAKLSGPGWLQSAITLGGVLGRSTCPRSYWWILNPLVQLLAMILGVIMLCVISYITLSTGRSFEAMRNEINWYWHGVG